MEEIDIKELLDFFKSKLYVFIFIVVFVCLAGCIYGLVLQKPMYSSYTTVILSGSDSAITQSDITLNKNLVNTYAEVVKSRRVLEKVIDDLSLNIKYEGLVGKISVSSVNNTEIIKISVSDTDSESARNIANATASFFASEVKDLYNMDNVNVLDRAIAMEKPYNINVAKQLIMYILIGAVLGFGILFVVYYFDRTIKSVEQVEKKIKLPILGTVQDNTRGGKSWKTN